MRSVSCPTCGKGFDISLKARTVRCPACTSPLRLDDLVLRQDHHGQIATMGEVTLQPHTSLSGVLVCGSFSSQGRFDGRAMVHGKIELNSTSYTAGELHGKSLIAMVGANMRVKASISPRPTPNRHLPVPSPSAGQRTLQLAPPKRAR